MSIKKKSEKWIRIILLIILFIALNIPSELETVQYIRNENMFLLTSLSGDLQYTLQSETTMSCDLSTITQLILNMENDGFQRKILNTNENSIDIIIEREEEKYRLRYERTGDFTCIGTQYEKSYLPLTYISEK